MVSKTAIINLPKISVELMATVLSSSGPLIKNKILQVTIYAALVLAFATALVLLVLIHIKGFYVADDGGMHLPNIFNDSIATYRLELLHVVLVCGLGIAELLFLPVFHMRSKSI